MCIHDVILCTHVHVQVWDVGEDGQWRCTSTWKVIWLFIYHVLKLFLVMCTICIIPAPVLTIGDCDVYEHRALQWELGLKGV